jgi:hypothetical protein
MKMWKSVVLMIPAVMVMGCQATCKAPKTVPYPPPGALIIPPQGVYAPLLAQPTPAPDRIAPIPGSAPSPKAAPAPTTLPEPKTSGFDSFRPSRLDLMTAYRRQ